MGLLELVGSEVKSALKSLPFSRYGGNWRGGYGSMTNGGWDTGTGYFGALPGTRYDYHEAAGVLWQNPSAAACFVALTKAFAQARPILEQRKGHKWEQVDTHPIIDRLNAPNQFYSGEKMFGVTLISTMSHGAAFWRLEKNRAGGPGEIWFEPPSGHGPTGIAPNWDEKDFVSHYTYVVDGKPIDIDREDVVFFRHGLHPHNPRLPWSPLQFAAREIATLNSASTYTGALLRNSAVPSGMLSMEGGGNVGATQPTPQQAEDMKDKIKAGFRGDNVGEPFVSSSPWKWTPFNWSPSDLSIDKIQQWPQGIVCALLATPAIVAMLPTGEAPTYENLDASMRWWWDNTIIPLEASFADDIETQLFPAFGLNNTDYRLEWDRSNVPALQEDQTEKHTMVGSDFKNGVIDRDEARVALGYESKTEYQGVFHPSATAGDPQAEPVSPEEAAQQERLNGAAKALANWEESKHPRDQRGRFTNGVILELGTRAKIGAPEAGYAIDLETGKQLDYAEASNERPDELELNPEAIANSKKVGLYHSHPFESPPSEVDWNTFLTADSVHETISVNPNSIYIMRKHEDRPVVDKYGGTMPALVALSRKARIKAQRGFARIPDKDMSDKDLIDIWDEVGRRMAADYDVILKKEDVP